MVGFDGNGSGTFVDSSSSSVGEVRENGGVGGNVHVSRASVLRFLARSSDSEVAGSVGVFRFEEHVVLLSPGEGVGLDTTIAAVVGRVARHEELLGVALKLSSGNLMGTFDGSDS